MSQHATWPDPRCTTQPKVDHYMLGCVDSIDHYSMLKTRVNILQNFVDCAWSVPGLGHGQLHEAPLCRAAAECITLLHKIPSSCELPALYIIQVSPRSLTQQDMHQKKGEKGFNSTTIGNSMREGSSSLIEKEQQQLQRKVSQRCYVPQGLSLQLLIQSFWIGRVTLWLRCKSKCLALRFTQ